MDLGGSVVTSIVIPAYRALRDHLGLPERPVETMELVQQIARVDPDVAEALGLDVLPMFANPPSQPTVIEEDRDGTLSFKDDFGATLIKPKGSFYFDWKVFPLPEPSLEALAAMPWPDPADPARYRGLRSRVKKQRESTDKALFGMAPCGHDLFNQIFRVRGMENGLMDLLAEPEFAEAFLDRLTDTICAAQTCFLKEVGDLIDVHFAADDLAGQSGPLVSPELWRRMIKPRQGRIIRTIKAHTQAKVFYHSCGAVAEFIPDLIEIGVDILNPVQVTAQGMDAANLKERFGKHLSFWGGGCDTQRILPFGTPAEVRGEVRRRVRELAPGGGFVFNPVHNIQPLTPPENIVQMFRTAREAGVYDKQFKGMTNHGR
ncbi:MAG TPA: uroporphyrinogen decarboxylase family protein [Phycisphaerae bacterium]|nr:uroporphyrinogen decarboxylase family protein [Phycisphaerae bacterium]